MLLMNVQVKEYGGKKSISLLRDSTIEYNSQLPLANSLRTWFESKSTKLHEIITSNEMKDVAFSTINEIFDMPPLTSINLLAICFDIGLLKNFTSVKSNVELKKREITLIDKLSNPIKLYYGTVKRKILIISIQTLLFQLRMGN